MRDIVDEEKLSDYIQLNTEVISAIWNEEKSRWIIKSRIDGGEESIEEFHYFVNAAGFLK
jgi:cation diffusion facilitator CzcD-associated flavoprotein CzcO